MVIAAAMIPSPILRLTKDTVSSPKQPPIDVPAWMPY